jgi:monoamine oxidase
MTNPSYDCLIVGAGMAGLYMGMQLRNQGVRFKILEKDSRVGGRAWTESFAGVDVSPGAGIGRRRKDKLLMQLMEQLDIPIHYFRVQTYRSPAVAKLTQGVEPVSLLKKLVRAFIAQNRPKTTFRTFATRVWGKKDYQAFILLNGYTDMENEDVEQTLTHYGLDDNLEQGWQGFGVPWAKLVQKMVKYVGQSRISTDEAVVRVSRSTEHFKVQTTNRVYVCKRLILAVPTRIVAQLVPEFAELYRLIPDQPFLRIYAQFDPESAKILEQAIQGTTIVSNALQKIIPIRKDKGVYMIAYGDNTNALQARMFTKRKIVELLQMEFGITYSLRILNLKRYFWKTGTHYYRPHPENISQHIFVHPESNLYVIGESVSFNQGWVEGALESVKRAIRKMDLAV